MQDFSIFGLPHILVLFTLIAGSILIFFWLTRTEHLTQNTFGKLISFGLIGQLIFFYAGHFWFRSFDPALHLPLHLCSLSAYLVILAILSKNQWLYKVVLFWSPISALLAILLPDMGASENFPSFRFIEFFWSHLLIVWGCVYILMICKPKLRYRDIWITFGGLIAILPIIKLLNSVFQSNYMYLERRANGGQMGFLPSEPWHVLGLIAMFCVVFHLEFLLYKLVSIKSKKY
jgi:hypothetical integral membrane protein (TIGR02206 family)